MGAGVSKISLAFPFQYLNSKGEGGGGGGTFLGSSYEDMIFLGILF